MKNLVKAILLILVSGCGSISNVLNPFYESPTPEALLGEKNDRALNETESKVDKARSALEAMSSYRRTHEAAPYDPVVQPAVVRLMWVPDHINKNGDLVPAHYYYLKVLSDRWAVSDAFELEAQLGKGQGANSAIPFTHRDDLDASK